MKKRLPAPFFHLLCLTAFLACVPDENVSGDTISGKEVFEKSCASCHSMRPPALAGPPVVGLSARYRTVYENRTDAVSAMVSFMKNPTEEKSALGPGAIERFGLMPPMSLSDEELETVAAWLWEQYEPDFEPRGNCGKKGCCSKIEESERK